MPKNHSIRDMSEPTNELTPSGWEYIVIEALSIKLLGASSTQYNLEDKAIKNALKGKNLSEGLTYLGSQGWELSRRSQWFFCWLKQLISKASY